MEKKRRRSSLAAKTVRSTVISCLLFGAVVLLVGLGFYAHTLSSQYITNCSFFTSTGQVISS